MSHHIALLFDSKWMCHYYKMEDDFKNQNAEKIVSIIQIGFYTVKDFEFILKDIVRHSNLGKKVQEREGAI